MPTALVAALIGVCGAGCGRIAPNEAAAGSEAPTTGPPVFLHTAWPMGCVTEAGRPQEASPDNVDAQLRSAARQMTEFRVSYMLQTVSILATSVEAAPRALSWSRRERNDGAMGIPGNLVVEGGSLVRRPGWGQLAMTVYFVPDADEGPFTDLAAIITYTPHSTTYDFGDETLRLTDTYLRSTFDGGYYFRGCDPETNMNIERFPGALEVPPFISCWRPGESVPPLVPGDRPSEEFHASRRLQCLQILERLVR